MNGNQGDDRGDFRALLAMLRRRAAVIVIAVIVGVAAALVFSQSQPKRYEATASLLFRPLLLDLQVTGVPLQNPVGDAQRDTATNIALLSLDDVRTRAAARLGPGYTAKRVEDDVSISAAGQSNIVHVTASEQTPQEAARVANAVALAFIAFRREGLRDQVLRAADKVRTNLKQKGLTRPVRTALRNNLTRLGLLAAVQTGDAQFVQRAEPPTHPSSPKTFRNVILGGALGLLLGLGLALAIEQLDRRVRRTDQLEEALELPLLAVVPRSKALRGRSDWGSRDAAGDEEPFRRLRASLRHTHDQADLRSVLVTSARADSGKTTVATHLAAAAAVGGKARVLLIEADLRRPRLATLLGLPSDTGLAQLLESEGPLDESAWDHVFRVPVSGGSNGSGPNGHAALTFDALPAGPPADAPSELLDSGPMRELLVAAQERYDLVVIEAPPPTLVSDAIPLMKQVDGVLIVGRLGHENDPELRALRDELKRFGVTPVGAVANFSRRVANPYYAKGR
jgi:Mrp family chromosome partitioning ATPase/capsular polysaccharide biosynthesis protein